VIWPLSRRCSVSVPRRGSGTNQVRRCCTYSSNNGFAPPANADPSNDGHDAYYNEDEYAEFYTPPDPLPPGEPGDLIRTEPSPLVLEPSGQLGAIIATGTRIMYRSTDARGNPMAVTGTYFEPDNDWPGQGARPLIV
jgi:hypothetical protein